MHGLGENKGRLRTRETGESTKRPARTKNGENDDKNKVIIFLEAGFFFPQNLDIIFLHKDYV